MAVTILVQLHIMVRPSIVLDIQFNFVVRWIFATAHVIVIVSDDR